MERMKPTLNFLVIAIMVVMTGFTSFFIYSNIHLKNRIILKIEQQTGSMLTLVSFAVYNALAGEHTRSAVRAVSGYADVPGIADVEVIRPDGSRAFANAGGIGARGGVDSKMTDKDYSKLRKTVRTGLATSFFDTGKKIRTGFAPIKAQKRCLACHKKEGELLGVLKVRFSTEKEFAVLDSVQRTIWALGLIFILPVIGFGVAIAMFREKGRLYSELKTSNDDLVKTVGDLRDTRGYMQMILDNTKATIITTDTHGRIVEFNKEAESLLEYSKDEMVGKDVLALYANPEQRLNIVENGKSRNGDVWAVRNREVELKSRSGKIIYLSLTLSVLLDDRGKRLGTVGVGKDISEQKMLQFKLIQSEKLAGIGTLASGIAHELNNPLAGVLGMAEAIRDEDDADLMKSYTNDIIQYTMNASEIVKQLSAYSRTVDEETKSTMELALVMDSALKMSMHSASFISISVINQMEQDCYIFANEGEMQQVFINLIINAIHAMGERGVLTLKCRREGELVTAQVVDTGSGIPLEHLKQIYDPFFSTKPMGKGTGLGLYVVYRMVTKYGGTIDCDSELGKGTTFTLKFPVCGAKLDDE